MPVKRQTIDVLHVDVGQAGFGDADVVDRDHASAPKHDDSRDPPSQAGNIPVAADGDPKVIGFGIARAVDPAATPLTTTLAEGAYPCVVFALEPWFGHIGSPPTIEHDRPRDPATRWCRWLAPADDVGALETLELRLASGVSQDVGDHLLARIIMPLPDGSDAYLDDIGLDASGIEIRRTTCDRYRSARKQGILPDPDRFDLLDIAELPAPTASSDGPA